MNDRVLCQVCGRPLPGALSLCGVHRNELVDALRSLSTGGQVRVRHHIVGRWRIPEAPVYRTVVDERPGLCADLDLTISRQHKLGGPGAAGRPSSPPLPLHEDAADAAVQLREVIVRWARAMAATYTHLTLNAKSIAAAAAWMALLPNLIAEHPDAGDMHREVMGAVKRVLRVVDREPDTIYLGQCGAEISLGYDPELLYDDRCEGDLYAPTGTDVMQCRWCGAIWEVAARRDYLLVHVEDQLATANETSRALSRLGRPVSASTIRWWAHANRLYQHSPHPYDRRLQPRYRIGDVLELVAARDAAPEGGGSAA